MQKITDAYGSIIESPTSKLNWEVIRLSIPQKLTTINFPNETHGWIASKEGTLYKTTDAGKTWAKTMPNVMPNAFVVSMYFVGPDLGWIAVKKPSSELLDYQNNLAWLLHTQDGGRTWNVQYTDKALAIHKVYFTNNQEGWASGIRYSRQQTLMTERSVLHTTDQGEHWVDVSINLNQSIKADAASNTDISDIGARPSSGVTLFNADGQIIGTNNGGQNWYLIGFLKTEHLGMTRMGVLENLGVWLLGGTNGKHGTYSVIAHFDGKDTWVKYRISGVRLNDTVFLSEDEVLACGAMAVAQNSATTKTDGVILRSTDRGRTWSIAYRNHLTNSINDLFVTSSNYVWAVADQGLILKAKL